MSPPRTPLLTVDAIVPRRGRVLLVRRGRPPFEGSWALPGGFVEVGETVEAAVVRELAEETGLRGKVTRLVGVYSDPGRDPRGHTITVVFEVSSPTGSPRGADDAREAAFHGPRLPPLAFDHSRILARWRAAWSKRR